jgi:hypothetical protein
MVVEHVVSFALKETTCSHIYHFRMGNDTTETREAGQSRTWKRELARSQQQRHFFSGFGIVKLRRTAVLLEVRLRDFVDKC